MFIKHDQGQIETITEARRDMQQVLLNLIKTVNMTDCSVLLKVD